jgi:hypothetical protein
MTQRYGLLAPATLPQAAIDELAVEAAKAIKVPAAVTRLAEDTAQAPSAARRRSSRPSSPPSRSAGSP